MMDSWSPCYCIGQEEPQCHTQGTSDTCFHIAFGHIQDSWAEIGKKGEPEPSSD